MDLIRPRREHHRVQALIDKTQDTKATLAVISTDILLDQCAQPIEPFHQRKRQPAFSDVAIIFGGIKADIH